jgi:hypothetical protein
MPVRDLAEDNAELARNPTGVIEGRGFREGIGNAVKGTRAPPHNDIYPPAVSGGE